MSSVRGGAPAAVAPEYSPPYTLALVASVVVFALYAITLGPSTWFWDTSEYITTAHILGIPHPPGNPLFVVLARAWELLLSPFGLSPAVRVNLFSAFMSAATAFFWYLVVHRILVAFTADERVRRIGSGVAVLLAATAFTVWNQSTVNEKVYTVSLLTIAGLSWLVFLWRDHTEAHAVSTERRAWHDDNALVLIVYVLALSVGNHLMAFLAAPALLVFVAVVRPQVLLNWKIYVWGAAFAFLGLSIHLFLPIRAALDPVINEADPTCSSLGRAVTSVLTFGRAGCEELSAALAREQYAKPPVTERLSPFWAQLAVYAQYFDWQWSRSLQGAAPYFAPARLPFTLGFAALGGFGAWNHWLRDRKSFAYVATLFATLSLGLVFYMNFRYGYSQVNVLGLPIDQAEVRERDYFFLVSFALWGLWAGIGLTALWLRAAARFGDRPRALLFGSPVLAAALVPLVLNWPYASRAGDYVARDWAYNVLQSVEPYGVLFTNGDNDTFPLWYVQEVEGIRKDVTVIVWSYLNTPWYAKQLRDLTTPCETPGAAAAEPTRILCQREFDPDTAPEIYHGLASYPSRTILPLSDEEIDRITEFGYVQLPQDVVFEARGAQTRLPAGTYLPAADQFILTAVKEAWGDRPIYFAGTTNAHRNLGLDAFAVRQGLAYKLTPPDSLDAPGIIPMPQDQQYSPIYGRYLDLPRMRALLDDVFVYRDILEEPHWTDEATRQIPTYFAYAYITLAQGLQMTGDDEAAERSLRMFEAWADLSQR